MAFEFAEVLMDPENQDELMGMPPDEHWRLLPEMQSEALAAGTMSFDMWLGAWVRFDKVADLSDEVMGFLGEGIELMVRRAPAAKIINLTARRSPRGVMLIGVGLAGQQVFGWEATRESNSIVTARSLAECIEAELRAQQALRRNQLVQLVGKPEHGILHPDTTLWPAKNFAVPSRRASQKTDPRVGHMLSLLPSV